LTLGKGDLTVEGYRSGMRQPLTRLRDLRAGFPG